MGARLALGLRGEHPGLDLLLGRHHRLTDDVSIPCKKKLNYIINRKRLWLSHTHMSLRTLAQRAKFSSPAGLLALASGLQACGGSRVPRARAACSQLLLQQLWTLRACVAAANF